MSKIFSKCTTKTEILVRSLRRPNGVTIGEICRKLSWQRHSVRAAISRHVRRNLRLDVTAEIVKGRGRVLKVKEQAAEELFQLIDPAISASVRGQGRPVNRVVR